jgi:hypothetical protein
MVALGVCAPFLAQTAPGAKVSTPPFKAKTFLPVRAESVQELRVDFNHDGGPKSVVLAYGVAGKDDPHDYTTTVKVFQYSKGVGWKAVFEDSDGVTNGGGNPITVGAIGSAGGKEGVMVTIETSGAGTAASWHIIAAVDGKFVQLDPSKIRDKLLKDRGYQDWGYNSVDTRDDLIFEGLPGYSDHTARCCPDRPSLDITMKFTGFSIELVSVEKEPFTPQKY